MGHADAKCGTAAGAKYGAAMPSPVLRTTFFIPPLRDDVVRRPRLLDPGNERSGLRLVLVSAPPGCGKTTLLSSWAQARLAAGGAVAWVTLAESDSEPATFWTQVATALDLVAPGVGAGALALLDGPHPAISAVLTALIRELCSWPGGIDLVLDDYHLADGPAIAADVSFLVSRLPPHVRVLIGTRADPALPLGRLRAGGELLELRAVDLRFTTAEASAYLTEVVGLSLDDRDIAVLTERTEGWVAAVQLAGLSLRDRADPAGFIAGFAGDHRYLVDYLVEEVLGRLPDRVRRFLLETSILDRFTAPLCDAVTGTGDGRSMLDLIERANLFLVPLDDTRRWYRYHHLFADVLRAHLVADPDAPRMSVLHARAARWYADAADPEPAVRYAVAAGDLGLVGDLVERFVLAMLRNRKEGVVRTWIDALPAEEVRRRPVAAVGFIGALMSSGQLDGVEGRLRDLDEVLRSPAPDLVVLDPVELQRIPGAIQTYRSALTLARGDSAAAVAHAERAVVLAAPGDDLTISAARALSGLASWGNADLAGAYAAYADAVAGLARAGNYSDVLGCSITLADIRITQGRLTDAEAVYADALRLAADHETGAPLRGTADMVIGQSRIAFERGQIERAWALLDEADRLGEQHGLPQHPYRWRVARARLLELGGDLDAAMALLEEAERVYVGDFSPNVRPVPAQRARLLLAQGRLPEALDWARHRNLTPRDDLDYVHEYEHITLARILLQQSATEASNETLEMAYELLGRLRIAAETGGRTGSLIEILALLAVAHHRRGRSDLAGALALLTAALRLAEPEDYVLVFVSLGPAMTELLHALTRTAPAWRYPRRLVDGLRPEDPRRQRRTHDLVDPLSPRELDVLGLLATDLAGPAIARELVISLNTVRTHTKSIYAKLGVTSRRAAVTRARDLGLLTKTR